MKINATQLILSKNLAVNTRTLFFFSIFLFVGLLFLSILKFDLLNPRFFYDQNTILNYMFDVDSFSFDSYPNTAFLYKILGINDNLILAVLFAYTVSLFVYFNLLFKEKVIDIFIFIYLGMFALLSAIFLQQYSKDIFVLLITFLLIQQNSKLAVKLFFSTALIYGLFFREYWLLILVFSLSIIIVDKYIFSLNKRRYLISVMLAGLLILAFAFPLTLGIDLTYYRLMVNEDRVGSIDASSIILPMLPTGSPILEFLNACITWFTLMIPFPLTLQGKVQQLVSFIIISALFLMFWKDVKYLINDQSSKVIIYFILSFTIIQSIFEPDYGSYIRHLTPILPLFIFLHLKAINQWRLNNAN